jgi:hypothetical protein
MIDNRDPIFAAPIVKPIKSAEQIEVPAPVVKKAAKPDEPKLATRDTAGPGCDRWQLPKEIPVTVRSKLPKYRVKLTGRGEHKDETKYYETSARSPSQARTYAEAAHPKWDAQTAIVIA